jgi:tetratricopeptide (TPR) repeat protein
MKAESLRMRLDIFRNRRFGIDFVAVPKESLVYSFNRIMKRQTVPPTAKLLRQGIKALEQHRPDRAVNFFRSATERIAVTEPFELANALYWLAVSLQQMGQTDLALKSLATAQKLERRGYARKIYVRATNQYGMLKRSCQDQDDFFAFMHLQLAKYLGKKPGHRFASFEEHEVVMATLFDTWKAIQTAGILDGQDCAEKVLYFRTMKISYPVVTRSSLSGANPGSNSSFSINRVTTPSRVVSAVPLLSRRCPCGSGLPYLQCCGRIKSIRELR